MGEGKGKGIKCTIPIKSLHLYPNEIHYYLIWKSLSRVFIMTEGIHGCHAQMHTCLYAILSMLGGTGP